MSPVKKHGAFRGSSSLISVLESTIDQVQKNHENIKKFALLAHRFSIQHRYWMDNEESNTLEKNLFQLVLNYMNYLPALIQEFDNQCEKVGWGNLSRQINSILLRLFEGQDSRQDGSGIVGLLDKVYFSHRIMEELHDHMICHCGRPIFEWDMTMANLLVHQLVGSQYSTRLDQTAIELSQKLMADVPKIPSEKAQDQDDAWPCFCKRFKVNLSFH